MIKIRPYDPADWARLCEIHDSARLDELDASVGRGAFLTLEQTAENEGLFDNRLFVAEVNDLVLGFVAYSEEELAWLYVDPSFYRRGVGRALVRHALGASASALRIEVLEGNKPALELYLAEGFTVIKRVEGNLVGNEAFAAAGLLLERQAP